MSENPWPLEASCVPGIVTATGVPPIPATAPGQAPPAQPTDPLQMPTAGSAPYPPNGNVFFVNFNANPYGLPSYQQAVEGSPKPPDVTDTSSPEAGNKTDMLPAPPSYGEATGAVNLSGPDPVNPDRTDMSAPGALPGGPNTSL